MGAGTPAPLGVRPVQHTSSSRSSRSGDEIEVIASAKDVESDIQPKEEPVDTQAEVEHKEESEKAKTRGRGGDLLSLDSQLGFLFS